MKGERTTRGKERKESVRANERCLLSHRGGEEVRGGNRKREKVIFEKCERMDTVMQERKYWDNHMGGGWMERYSKF